jgi:hypothetical protein
MLPSVALAPAAAEAAQSLIARDSRSSSLASIACIASAVTSSHSENAYLTTAHVKAGTGA